MKHFVSVAILVAISTLLVKTGLDAVGLLPVEASAQAVPIDRTHANLAKALAN